MGMEAGVMNMKTTVLVLGFALLLPASAAWACSATSAMDVASQAKDSDAYEAARDVVEDLADDNGYDGVQSIDAGVGTLLTEAALNRDGQYWATNWDTHSDKRGTYQSLLNQDSFVWKEVTSDNFWRDSSGRYWSFASSTYMTHQNLRKVRDHVTAHMEEWHEGVDMSGNSLAPYGWTPPTPSAPAPLAHWGG
jgi:hypothetical protein